MRGWVGGGLTGGYSDFSWEGADMSRNVRGEVACGEGGGYK